MLKKKEDENWPKRTKLHATNRSELQEIPEFVGRFFLACTAAFVADFT